MSYNKYKYGLVYKKEEDTGVGDIVSEDKKKYMFTITDIGEETFNMLKKEDLVRFRAELVNDVPKAFFVKKIKKPKR